MGKLIKYNCKENKDYIVSRDFAKNSKGGRKKTKIKLTLDCSKKIAMRENNPQGDFICDYFILIEKTLRNYKEWADVRGEEKSGYNNMVMELTKWIERNGHDIKDLKVFRVRECNMLNIALTGMSATEIRSYFESKDEITRDNLTTEYNKALSKLQELNTSLLISDLDYTMRSGIIESTCKRQYPHLYVKEQMEKIS